MIKAKVITHSISPEGVELITLQTEAPKFLDAEVEKHRMISSNSSSDRAVPFNTMLKRRPFIPTDIRKNQAGMQGEEKFDGEELQLIRASLNGLYDHVTKHLKMLSEQFPIHKQHLNRYLLGFSMQSKVMTATREEWNYFLSLRLHEAADPAIYQLAQQIKTAIDNSVPALVDYASWHLPYIAKEEFITYHPRKLAQFSVARCARVSYLNHDGSEPDRDKDVKLYNQLKDMKHWSCFEHIARPVRQFNDVGITHTTADGEYYSGNFKGWIQLRHDL